MILANNNLRTRNDKSAITKKKKKALEQQIGAKRPSKLNEQLCGEAPVRITDSAAISPRACTVADRRLLMNDGVMSDFAGIIPRNKVFPDTMRIATFRLLTFVRGSGGRISFAYFDFMIKSLLHSTFLCLLLYILLLLFLFFRAGDYLCA